MCDCTDDKLCEKAEAWWTELNLAHENPPKFGKVENQRYREIKAQFVTHRTYELREKGFLIPGATTGYEYYPDWRERLLPTWQEKR